MQANLDEFVRSRKAIVDDYLSQNIAGDSARLVEAMRYASLNGGKRIRAILCLAAIQAVDPIHWQKALPVAAGLECLHAMSLIHDDLPCMDDADMRRKQPSCHKKFDEATALLAGDALLVQGLIFVNNLQINANIKSEVFNLILRAVGAYGMCAGQMLDLTHQPTNAKIEENVRNLNKLHNLKTGALIKAAVLSGALIGGAKEPKLNALDVYADSLGLLFQITDDILDVEGNPDELGKPSEQDIKASKLTYVSLYGLSQAKSIAEELSQKAKLALSLAEINFEPLLDMVDFVLNRRH